MKRSPPSPVRVVPESSQLATAVRLHQAGRLAEAEALYRAVLARMPREADALHLLGLAIYQRGDHAGAIELMQAALALRPNFPAAHVNLGNAYFALGDAANAAACHRRALALVPGDPVMLNNLGNALVALGECEEAVEAYRAALVASPGHVMVARGLVNAHVRLGNLELGRGRLDVAEAAYREAHLLAPEDADANTGLGVIALRTGRVDTALAHLEVAHRTAPNSALAMSNLAAALRLAGRPEAALPLLREAIEADPCLVDAHCNLGAILLDSGDPKAALLCFERAIALDPSSYEARANVACALCDLGRYTDAEVVAAAAAELAPHHPGALATLGRALAEQGRATEAIAACRRALTLAPTWAEAHWNMALPLLRLGAYEEGWRAYEWRFKAVSKRMRRGPAELPAWQGESLAGRTILVYWEQGLGDSIQFARYLPMLAARGARVVLECQAPLRRLFEGLPGVAAIVSSADEVKAIKADVQVALLSLPALLGTTGETIPAEVPYLRARALRAEERAEMFGDSLKNEPRLRVGLVWAGSAAHANDGNRSIGLERLRPLLAVPGVEWYSLQVGPRAKDLAAVADANGIVDLTPKLSDFSDTAAVIAQLDLVITVDTAVAHLAGALGRPVWILLPFVPDWRWLLDRSDTPWYPTARLFRQASLGDWAGVVAELVHALGDMSLRV